MSIGCAATVTSRTSSLPPSDDHRLGILRYARCLGAVLGHVAPDRLVERVARAGGPRRDRSRVGAESAEWREAGLDVALITDGYVAELAPTVTVEWWRAGFQPSVADELLSMGIDLDEAQALTREVGSAALVLSHPKPF